MFTLPPLQADFPLVKTKQEIAAVARLAAEIWQEHYTPIIGKAQVDYMLRKFQSPRAISQQIHEEGFEYYLVVIDSPAGYIAVHPQHNQLFLSKLYLNRVCRGKGIGRQALEFVFSLAENRKLPKVALTVNKGNDATVSIYKKLGFKVVDSFINDIGEGFVMDDYRMEKEIKLRG